MEMAQQAYTAEVGKILDDMVPNIYDNYCNVFEKKSVEWFPELCPYDHTINLKPEFIPHNCKVYPLLPKK